MPSRRHDLLAAASRGCARVSDLDSEPQSAPASTPGTRPSTGTLPTRPVRGFDRRFAVRAEELDGFAAHVLTPPRPRPGPHPLYLHGGGYMSGIDPFHLLYAARLASALRRPHRAARLPAGPEHTWRDSYDALVAHAARWAGEPGGTVLAGNSAGGGLALARGAVDARPRAHPGDPPRAARAVGRPDDQHARHRRFAKRDPWLFLGKVHAYAAWWAGSPEDLGRPEVSPGPGRPGRAAARR